MAFAREVDRYEQRPLEERLWRAGHPNAAVSGRSAKVAVQSLCLTAGSTYEVEGAIGETGDQAKTFAVLQDLLRVKEQLTPPILPELLYERRPRTVTALQPQGIPAVYAVGEEAETRLGLNLELAEGDLDQEGERRRRVVRRFRQEGWGGAIVLPGLNEGTQVAVVPRSFLPGGSLRVRWRGKLQELVPRHLVDFALGQEPDYPSTLTLGSLVPDTAPQVITTSWQPTRLTQRRTMR